MIDNGQQKILRAGISKYAPVLAEFFEYKKTLAEHSASLQNNDGIDDIYFQRQIAITSTIGQELKRLYNLDYPGATSPLTINIVDHHAILTHPILVATNIVSNAYQLLEPGPKKPTIVFSSGIVPPNNFLNKKGLHLHSKSISLFQNNEIHQAAYFIPKHDFHFINRLKKNKQWQTFSEHEQNFLEEIEKEICTINMDKAKDYADQVGLINSWLWPRLFAKELRDFLPSLNYIPSEEIIRLNIERVLSEETILYQALFNPAWRGAVFKEFDGIAGCWGQDGERGTHFFWYRSSDNVPIPLKLVNDTLVTSDGATRISFTKETIIDLVKEKKIIPSLLIIYGWIIFWCGVRPLSGYGSSTYLTKMKAAWIKVLSNYDKDEMRRLETIDTKSLIGGEIVTYKRSDDTLQSQCALDVMYDGGLSSSYVEHLVQMNFGSLVMPCLPEVYQSYVPLPERQPLSITSHDMMDKSFDWIK